MLTRDFVCAQTSEEYYTQPENVGINEFLNSCLNASPDDELWEAFYNKFNPHIINYVRKALVVRNQTPTKETIEDIVQDVYTAIFKLDLIARFKGTHENIFFGYLSIISINAVRLKLQHRRAVKRKAYIVPLDTVKTDPTRSFDPELERIEEVHIVELFTVMEYLCGKRDTEIFKLYYLQGFTAKELSQFGLKPNSIYGVIKNVKKRMRG